jgi:hypothetical protein
LEPEVLPLPDLNGADAGIPLPATTATIEGDNDMDSKRFDALARSLGGSRRSLLAGGLALTAGGLGASALDARKRKKRKKRKPTARPNEFGCLEVNDPCARAEECCSGICEGKKCRAHDTGTCRQDRQGVCSATTNDVPTLTCGNDCYCFRTTAGSNFCAVPPAAVGDPKCVDCKKDADCQALGFPAGSACVPVDLGHCSGRCATGMACLVPCGVDFPQPTG